MKHFRLIIIALVFLLSACGFHLRGQVPISKISKPLLVHRNHISEPFYQALTLALRDNRVPLKQQSKSPYYSLDLLDEQITKDLATTGTNTLTRTFILTYKITYQVFDPKGHPLSLPQTIKILRPFNENMNTVLSSQHEEVTYLKEMRAEAALRLINQISIQMRHHENQSPRLQSSSKK